MNIIIDGNAFLSVSVSIVKNILAKNISVGERFYVSDLYSDKYILKDASIREFKRFSMNYLNSILFPFKENLDSVFFVFDSKSWRNDFISQHSDLHGSEDFKYKADRKFDEHSYLFFDYFREELIPILSTDYGLYFSRVNGAEGDDIIAYLCESLDDDICIWTVDKDLIQLAENNTRKIILLMPKMMAKYKRIYTTENFNEIKESKIDLFNLDASFINNSSIINIINDLSTKGYKHLKIDPTFEILTKILAGDKSDSIPRLHRKLTPTKVNKVIDLIKENTNWNEIINLIDSDDSEFTKLFINIICDTIKLSESSSFEMILNNYKRNRSIIRLNSKFFPKEIRSNIKKSINLENLERFKYFKFKKNLIH